MATDQFSPLLLQCGSHPCQRLAEQLHLMVVIDGGHGHDRLHRGGAGTRGPQIGAGMEGGQSSVEPGIRDQGREAIHRAEHCGAVFRGANRLGILRSLAKFPNAAALQGLLEGGGWELGCAPAAGHGGFFCLAFSADHGVIGLEHVHEALIEMALPAPDPAMGASPDGAPDQPGRGCLSWHRTTEQLQRSLLGAP